MPGLWRVHASAWEGRRNEAIWRELYSLTTMAVGSYPVRIRVEPKQPPVVEETPFGSSPFGNPPPLCLTHNSTLASWNAGFQIATRVGDGTGQELAFDPLFGKV